VPPSMGAAIAITFQPTGDDKAAIAGDFVLLGKEFSAALKAMRDNGPARDNLNSLRQGAIEERGSLVHRETQLLLP